MIESVKLWMLSPLWGVAHWMYLAGAYALVCFVLSKIPKVRANTVGEAIFNFINPKLKPFVMMIPKVGPLLAGFLDLWDSPAPKKDEPKTASGTINGAMVLLFVGLGGMTLAALTAGCFSPAVYYKTVATTAVTAEAAYAALDRVDADKEAALRVAGHIADLRAWQATYDKARKGIDVVADTVSGAMREGPPLEGLIANPKSYQKWLDALTVAVAAVGLALTDAGVNWQQLVTGGK